MTSPTSTTAHEPSDDSRHRVPDAKARTTHAASEEQLRFVTDHLPVLLVQCDRDTRLTFVNAPYAARFGLRPQDVIGKRLPEVLGQTAYNSFRHHVEAAIAGTRVEFEQEIPYDYGNRWMHCIYVPEHPPEEAPTGFIAVIQDVTERKHAEARERTLIERSDAATVKFEAIFNQSGIFQGIMGLDGVLREVNDMAIDWCGYTRDQVLNRPFWQTPWWRGSEEMKERVRFATRQAAAGVTFREVLRYWVAGGAERIMEFALHPIRDASGKVVFLNSTGIDITERIRVERALRAQMERAALLSKTLEELLAAKDEGGIARGVFPRIAAHVGADAFFNFMVDPGAPNLRLHAYAGIPEDAAETVAVLRPGQGVCGCVAAERRAMHVTDIQAARDETTSLVRSFGIKAYCCNPLLVGDHLLGTLSFGTRTRTRFAHEDLEFLATVSQYVAIAIHRLRSEAVMRQSEQRLGSHAV